MYDRIVMTSSSKIKTMTKNKITINRTVKNS